jgi:hypothetical protein
MEEEEDTIKIEKKDQQKKEKSDLYPYQCVLFFITQFGYIAVVPSMLSTTFFEPNIVCLFFFLEGRGGNIYNILVFKYY